MKVLPSGVYQYRLIVDGQWKYAPELPWTQDDAGNTYNLLDLKVILLSSPLSIKCVCKMSIVDQSIFLLICHITLGSLAVPLVLLGSH